MARFLSLAVIVALVAGTAVAFAVTERLKLVRSPIFQTRVENKVFSPVCDCPSEEAIVSFRLREPDGLSVRIVDGDGEIVRTLISSEPTPAGDVRVGWDGRDDDGAVVPEGTYNPRIHLDEQRRTILLPNPIEVDTTSPRVLDFRVEPDAISPDRDGRNDKLEAFYEFSEPAHALLYVGGERRVRSRRQPLTGKVEWFGIVDGASVPRGTYAVTLAGEDRAGNVSEPAGPELVRIRYVTLGRSLVRVPAGVRFGIRVETDAARFRWRFAGGSRAAEPGLLVLRAPRRPGRYTLFVEANGRGARAEVIVEPRGG